jgi:ABC-2 type transport system permease protein
MLPMCVLGAGIQPLFQRAGQGSYIQFLCPGVIGTALLFTSALSGLGLVLDRQVGFLKQTLVAPAPRILIMLGRALGGATVSLVQALIVMVVCVLVGFRPVGIQALPMALAFMLLIALMLNALTTAIACVLNDQQGMPLLVNFLFVPMSFFSGAYYPLTDVPIVVKWLSKLDLLFYGVDGLRGVFVGTYHFSPLTDFAVMSLATMVLIGIGSYLFSRMET